jgi:hypothetical protein
MFDRRGEGKLQKRGAGTGRAVLQLESARPEIGGSVLTATCDRNHGSRVIGNAQYSQRCSMPVLVIAIVFFAIFLVMGVMGVTAMVAEHRGHLFSWKWSDEPKPTKR